MSPSQSTKQRILTCLTKLSDRDTFSLAAAELESIAWNLDSTSLPVFISCIISTDSSDKTLVRKHCVQLLQLLSETHRNALSPYFSKILAAVVRRLRDPDSAVRSACVDSVAALSRHVTKQPFSCFVKPLSEALFTEQDPNSQIGAALCLASAIDGAPDPDPARLAKMLPRFEKLLKREGFRAKPALLTLIGSVVCAGGASSPAALRSLVPCLMESLGSEDWAVRKAAAEALAVLANVERDALSEFKDGCLKVCENRRFDKVKLVREVMNQMLEAWKQIPDVSDEFSPPPQSQSSSKENASDGRYPPVSQNSCSPGSATSNLWKKSTPVIRFSPPDSSSATNSKNVSACNSKRVSPVVSRKLNHKNLDVQIAVSNASSEAIAEQGDPRETDGAFLETNKRDKSRVLKPEMRRALFSKTPDDTMQKFGGSKAGSSVVPYHEESQQSVAVRNVRNGLCRNDKESEDLTLIHHQLHQIEKQQSSLLDLLQKFIGSSQNGMHSLENRVRGLELALDEISYDLVISSGRMYNSNVPGNSCCLLPKAEFFSSKFWRKTQGRYSSPRFSRFGATPFLAATHYKAVRNAESNLRNHRLRHDGAFIINPLAEVHTNPTDLARSEPV